MKECITPCYFFLSSPLKFISDKYSLTLFYTIFVIRRKNERKRKTEKEPKKNKIIFKIQYAQICVYAYSDCLFRL